MWQGMTQSSQISYITTGFFIPAGDCGIIKSTKIQKRGGQNLYYATAIFPREEKPLFFSGHNFPKTRTAAQHQ